MSKKLRILFVRTNYLPGRLGGYVVPPLGILTLISLVRRDLGDKAEAALLDTGLERLSPENTVARIRDYNPDIVGISSLSLESSNLHVIAGVAKSVNPNIKVVVGGPHATNFYDEVLKDANVDYCVIGEGEGTFLDVVSHIRDGATPPKTTPGLAQRVDGEVVFGGPRPYVEDLDSLPIPAYDIIDLKKYSRFTSMNTFISRTPYAPIFSSRACPYKCAYCHGIFGKRFRHQSPERTVEEITMLHRKFGVKEIHVYDDVFNFDRDRVMKISDMLRSGGVKTAFAFPNGVRADIMTPEVVKAMVGMGAYSITYAIETASPRLQKMIHKNLDLEKARQVIEWTYDEGIMPCGFFMLGFPSETPEEMRATVDYAVNSKMLRAMFFSVVPFPRTELHRIAMETYPNFDFKYSFSPTMYYWSKKPFYSEVTGYDVKQLQYQAWREFYLKPWRMAGLLRRLPKNLTFLKSIYYGIAFGARDGDSYEGDLVKIGAPAAASEGSCDGA